MTPETKVVNLHAALSDLLYSFRDMVNDCNQEPLFGEHGAIVAAEKALFENRPDAAWEPEPTRIHSSGPRAAQEE